LPLDVAALVSPLRGGLVCHWAWQAAGLARPASSFLLLAQKNGTKEEGLSIRSIASARKHG